MIVVNGKTQNKKNENKNKEKRKTKTKKEKKKKNTSSITVLYYLKNTFFTVIMFWGKIF